MPFLVRPPPEHAATDEYSHTYTIIEPDANDRTILRDLQHWGWLVSQHDFDDEDFIYALKGTEKDTRERKLETLRTKRRQVLSDNTTYQTRIMCGRNINCKYITQSTQGIHPPGVHFIADSCGATEFLPVGENFSWFRFSSPDCLSKQKKRM